MKKIPGKLLLTVVASIGLVAASETSWADQWTNHHDKQHNAQKRDEHRADKDHHKQDQRRHEREEHKADRKHDHRAH